MYDICFIDDTIPVAGVASINDRERLNRSNLKLLLDSEISWSESAVKLLVETLISDETTWNVSAFIHPDLYLNSTEKEGYRPDIIIYDWEYAGGGRDSSSMLLEIVRSSFAVIYIYTEADHESQVERALAETDLNKYREKRIFLLMKNEEDSHGKLLQQARECHERVFSFRFGKCLREATMQALDRVLVNLGSYDIDFVKHMLAEEGTEETDVKSFVIEKMRHNLLANDSLREILGAIEGLNASSIDEIIGVVGKKITDEVNSVRIDMGLPSGAIDTDEESSRNLWSQRLYYRPSDVIVRKGDIIFQESSRRHYLVITADCDLRRFWSKNFGFINIVPLYCCEVDADQIKGKLLLTKTEERIKAEFKKPIQSLTGKIGGLGEGLFVAPYIKIGEDMRSFIGFPKEITNIKVEAPDIPGNERKDCPLLYNHMIGYNRISTVSEPFVTALVQHCIQQISGYGTPDYPEAMRKSLATKIHQSLFGRTQDEEE